MADITQYLEELNTQRNQLAENLTAMGVESDHSEKLNTLVPKVLEIETGVDTSDATATAGDIAVGKTAYVNGEKVEGTKEEVVQNVEFADTQITGSITISCSGQIIKRIIIPEGITEATIGKGVEKLVLPSTLTGSTSSDLYSHLYQDNYNTKEPAKLKYLVVPSSVRVAGDYFNDDINTSLEEIEVILSSISTQRKFVNAMFGGNAKLKKIIIPKGITNFGLNIFVNCINLSDIFFRGTEAEWNAISKKSGWDANGMGSNVTGGTQIHFNYTG